MAKDSGLKTGELLLRYALQNAIKYRGKADVSAILGKVLRENPKLKPRIKEISKQAAETAKQVNEMPLIEQISELKRIAPELLEEKKHERQEAILPELPNAKGKIVMRFAPFPSGPLHIGNARPAVLNDEYCKKYKGKLLLIMDDTIGSEEKEISRDAYNLIPEGLKWLNVNFEPEIVYKSDRLKIYYEYAEKLIEKGRAYVCFCSVNELRKNRENSKECKCRSHSIKDNAKEWKNMLQGKYKEGQATLRIKTSMKDENPAFRDRVLFRISAREHPRTGRKYSVWPLLEFSWAIDDHLLGITHIIRGTELMMESEMEKYIWNIFKWKCPVLIHSGLLHLEGIKLSKSKSKKEVVEGKYIGWDDPRTWSLQSLKRRGIQSEAVRKFCLSFGLTQHDATAPIDILYAENKKFTEKSDRYFFIANPARIKIETAPNANAEIPLHPDHAERGTRKFQTGQEFYVSKDDYEYMKKNKGIYRFMHLFNFSSADYFSYHSTKMRPELDAKLIHWLPADSENEGKLIKAEILMPDASITKGLAEKGIENLQENDIIQFERFGFCRFDRKNDKDNKFVFWFCHK